jgi:hypothetical protein
VKPRVPSPATLRKYGLTLADWLAVAERQGWVCAVCKRLPNNGRLCVDHDHVKGWKAANPTERRRHVRGLLCFFCNHYYVGRAITVAKAEAVAEYLRRHEARRDAVPAVRFAPAGKV